MNIKSFLFVLFAFFSLAVNAQKFVPGTYRGTAMNCYFTLTLRNGKATYKFNGGGITVTGNYRQISTDVLRVTFTDVIKGSVDNWLYVSKKYNVSWGKTYDDKSWIKIDNVDTPRASIDYLVGMMDLVETTTSKQTSSTKARTHSKGPTSGIAGGHNWIDLGLSVLWATANIDAEDDVYGKKAAWQAGCPFAWGESSRKKTYPGDSYPRYMWRRYKYASIDQNASIYDEFKESQLTKYTRSDSRKVLESSDDAATQLWGNGWRTPTSKEFLELVNKCKWEWKQIGYKVTGPNGNSIIMPLTGAYDGDQEFATDICGCFWTSDLCTDNPTKAYFFQITNVENNRYKIYDCVRCRGFYIRPVRSR